MLVAFPLAAHILYQEDIMAEVASNLSFREERLLLHELNHRINNELAGIISRLVKPGDYVVCLGAGNITQWAYALPGELAALSGKR